MTGGFQTFIYIYIYIYIFFHVDDAEPSRQWRISSGRTGVFNAPFPFVWSPRYPNYAHTSLFVVRFHEELGERRSGTGKSTDTSTSPCGAATAMGTSTVTSVGRGSSPNTLALGSSGLPSLECHAGPRLADATHSFLAYSDATSPTLTFPGPRSRSGGPSAKLICMRSQPVACQKRQGEKLMSRQALCCRAVCMSKIGQARGQGILLCCKYPGMITNSQFDGTSPGRAPWSERTQGFEWSGLIIDVRRAPQKVVEEISEL